MGGARRIIGFALCLGFGGGCEGLADLVENEAYAAVDFAARATMSENSRYGRELDGPRHCVEFTAPIATQARAHYHAWADPEYGPNSSVTTVGGVLELPADPSCSEGLQRSRDTLPEDPELDIAANEFEAAYGWLRLVSARAHRYYAAEEHRRDGFGTGRDLHPELEAAFARFQVAAAVLREVVSDRNTTRLQARLDRLEAEHGRNLRFHVERVVASARAVALTASRQPFDCDAFDAATDDYHAVVTEARAHADEYPDEIDDDDQLESFFEHAAQLRAAASEVRTRVSEEPSLSATERMHLDHGNAHLVSGTPHQLSRVYRRLASDASSLSRRS